ncbi:hypothetical protein, partial [Intrasporangium sp.]|uniref:hypothetical protein n=1 Tax=Intrasporangium sp. TaxID=1925024 RepID=UPI00293B7CF9
MTQRTTDVEVASAPSPAAYVLTQSSTCTTLRPPGWHDAIVPTNAVYLVAGISLIVAAVLP